MTIDAAFDHALQANREEAPLLLGLDSDCGESLWPATSASERSDHNPQYPALNRLKYKGGAPIPCLDVKHAVPEGRFVRRKICRPRGIGEFPREGLLVLKTVRGAVVYYKAIGRQTAQLELAGIPAVIEITCEFPYVLNTGDIVRITGEEDEDSGKFLGYAYVNETRKVRGSRATRYGFGITFVVAAIVFCWGIFPLFAHLPVGIRALRESSKTDAAKRLVRETGSLQGI